jgi:hypothetical protein
MRVYPTAGQTGGRRKCVKDDMLVNGREDKLKKKKRRVGMQSPE